MSIIISMPDGDTTKLEESGVRSEAYLQRYISANPETLPLDEYKEDTQLLILIRELPTRSGAIDALGVDQDGEIYVIETKLYKNPDKRLVLAQVLDYGASLWRTYTDPGELVGLLHESAQDEFGMDLDRKLEEVFGLGKPELEDFYSSLRANITEGNFRFVALMDRIQDRLKDLITFVNQNSRFDVFGVELEFYRHEEMQILVPRLYGAEVKKSVDGSGSRVRRQWDEKSFFEDAEERLRPDYLNSVRRLFSWADQRADEVSWGTGSQRGSSNPKFRHVHPSKSVFTVYSDGKLVLRFGWLAEAGEANPYAERLGAELRASLGEFSVSPDFMGEHLSVPVNVWAKNVTQLTQILEDVLTDSDTGPNGGT